MFLAVSTSLLIVRALQPAMNVGRSSSGSVYCCNLVSHGEGTEAPGASHLESANGGWWMSTSFPDYAQISRTDHATLRLGLVWL